MFESNCFSVLLSMRDIRVVSGEIDVILDWILLLAYCVDFSQILKYFCNSNSKYILNCSWFSQLILLWFGGRNNR